MILQPKTVKRHPKETQANLKNRKRQLVKRPIKSKKENRGKTVPMKIRPVAGNHLQLNKSKSTVSLAKNYA